MEVSLREYIEALLCQHEKRNDIERGMLRQELERRLYALNNLREAVEKDRGEFLRHDVYDVKIALYGRWINLTNQAIARIETRSITWTAAVGVLFTLVQIALHFLK